VSGVAWNGEVACTVHQRSLRTYPPGLGPSAFAETVAPDPRLDAVVRRIVAALGWSGIFQIQVMQAEGRSYVIDVNLRMYGSLALAVAAGCNLPAIWADLALGREPRIGGYRSGVRYRSEERDLFALLSALRSADWRTAAQCVVPRARTTHAIVAARDPLPLLTTIDRFRRRSRAARAPREAGAGVGVATNGAPGRAPDEQGSKLWVDSPHA
jgi:predicted ATP-grasp superfamily ATP-dependent carboligase